MVPGRNSDHIKFSKTVFNEVNLQHRYVSLKLEIKNLFFLHFFILHNNQGEPVISHQLFLIILIMDHCPGQFSLKKIIKIFKTDFFENPFIKDKSKGL